MYESADAVCPYYKKHTAKKIICEGRKNNIPVNGWIDAENHIRSVCGSFAMWKKCPIAEKLNIKYGVR